MTNCIYPGPHSDTMSKEHYLPAALGSFEHYEPLAGRLCATCNSKLGNELDVQLTRVGLVGLMRWILGVQGRDGLPPSPFYRGAGKAPAVVAYGRIEGFDFPVALDCKPGSTDAVPMRQIILRHDLLGAQAFPIFDGWTPERFLERLKEEGWHTARPVLLLQILPSLHGFSKLLGPLTASPILTGNLLRYQPSRLK